MMRIVAGLVLVLGGLTFGQEPRIDRVDPTRGFDDEPVKLEIVGDGFRDGDRVGLSRGGVVSLGRLPIPRGARALAASGVHAYVATQGEGILVVDLSDPANPQSVGQLDVPFVRAMEADGELLYAVYSVQGATGLTIFDTSDPTRPVLISESFFFVLRSQNISVENGTAYLSSNGRVLILDVSDPAHPESIGDDMFGSAPLALGDRLYVGEGFRTPFRVYDVSDPSNPLVLGELSLSETARDIVVRGNIVYMATDDGLMQIDVSDETNPELVSLHETDGRGRHLLIENGVAFVAETGGVISPIDVHDPSSPALRGPAIHVPASSGLAVSGGHLLAASDEGLNVLQIGTYARTRPVSPFPDVAGAVNDIVLVDGGFAYVVADKLNVFDVSDAAHPRHVGSVPGRGAIAVQGDRAYAGLYRVSRYDISDPVLPALLSTLTLSSFPTIDSILPLDEFVVVSGNSATNGLICLLEDLGTSLEVISCTTLSSRTYGVARQGDTLYVAGGFVGLHVMDISDPQNPVHVKRIPYSGNVQDVEVRGSRAYLAAGTRGLLVLDISDPWNPVLQFEVELDRSAIDVDLHDGVAIVASGLRGLNVVEIQNAPFETDRIEVPGFTLNSALNGTFAYTADFLEGAHVGRINPGLPDAERLGPDRLEVIVPPGFSPGPYHATVSGEHGLATAFNVYSVCDRTSVAPKLEPVNDPRTGELVLPVQWQLQTPAFDPANPPALLLDDLTAAEQIEYVASDEHELLIERFVFPGVDRSLIRLTGPDEPRARAAWRNIREAQAIGLPQQDLDTFGPFGLGGSQWPIPGAGPPFPPGSALDPRRARRVYTYELIGRRLANAQARGEQVDMRVRTTVPEVECEGFVLPISFFDEKALLCEDPEAPPELECP